MGIRCPPQRDHPPAYKIVTVRKSGPQGRLSACIAFAGSARIGQGHKVFQLLHTVDK